jgi:hypothetical protein
MTQAQRNRLSRMLGFWALTGYGVGDILGAVDPRLVVHGDRVVRRGQHRLGKRPGSLESGYATWIDRIH